MCCTTSYCSSNVIPAFWANVSKHCSGRSPPPVLVLPPPPPGAGAIRFSPPNPPLGHAEEVGGCLAGNLFNSGPPTTRTADEERDWYPPTFGLLLISFVCCCCLWLCSQLLCRGLEQISDLRIRFSKSRELVVVAEGGVAVDVLRAICW